MKGIRGLCLTEMGVIESVNDKNEEYFNYFLLLCKRHPNYESKFKNFQDFRIVREDLNKKGLGLGIINDDESFTEISWITCVKGVTKATKELFIGALRCVIVNQIYEFRKSTDLSFCRLCNTSLIDKIVHIDYDEKQFSRIVSDF